MALVFHANNLLEIVYEMREKKFLFPVKDRNLQQEIRSCKNNEFIKDLVFTNCVHIFTPLLHCY